MQVIEPEQHYPASGDWELDIQKEIEISKHQPVVFIAGTELEELYKEMKQHWVRPGEQGCDSFIASVFYNLGRTHGIQEERARRKAAGGASRIRS